MRSLSHAFVVKKSIRRKPRVKKHNIAMEQKTALHHTVYLIRHGESVGNVQAKFLPQEEDILTPMGQKQVDALGQHLAGVNFTRIISSDYKRAQDTAQAIIRNSKYDTVPNLECDSRLRERDVGVLEGCSYKDGIKALLASGEHVLKFNPQGAETMESMAKKAATFFQELCTTCDNSEKAETIAIISHSFWLMSLLQVLTSSKNSYNATNWENHSAFKLIRNASYIGVNVQRNNHGQKNVQRDLHFFALHCTEHLKNLDKDTGGDNLKFLSSTLDGANSLSQCIHV